MSKTTKNIRFVLVETSHPGNIGSTARAMKTMGFEQLTLVNPQKFPDEFAVAMASHADDVLDNAKVVSTFKEAVADCDLIIGTSARSRNLPWTMLAPRELTSLIKTRPFEQMAIVFGRERTGLTNEELAACHYHLQIPTSQEYMSLNLAQAVQVIAYELQLAVNAGNDNAFPEYDKHATMEQMQGFYEHMESALTKIQFLDPRRPKKLKERLTRVFQRAQLEMNEVDLLRGIFSRVEDVCEGKFKLNEKEHSSS